MSPFGSPYRGVIIRVDGEDTWSRVVGGADYPDHLALLELTIDRTDLSAMKGDVDYARCFIESRLFRYFSSRALAAHEKTA